MKKPEDATGIAKVIREVERSSQHQGSNTILVVWICALYYYFFDITFLQKFVKCIIFSVKSFIAHNIAKLKLLFSNYVLKSV